MPDDRFPYLNKLRDHLDHAARAAPRGAVLRRRTHRVAVATASVAVAAAAFALLFVGFHDRAPTHSARQRVATPSAPGSASPGARPHRTAAIPGPSVAPSGTAPAPGPAPFPVGDQLSDVVAIAPDDAWAVGTRYPASGGLALESLVERWNGNRWLRVEVPDVGPLAAVAASGPADVWALNGARLIHYDGAEWRQVPTPKLRDNFNDVFALAPDDAWLVGWRSGDTYAAECGEHRSEELPLVEHWDGARWHVVPIPRPPVHLTFLAKVEGTSSSDVWIGGTYETDVPPTRPGNGCANGPPAHDRSIAVHWNGRTWTIVPTHDPGPDTSTGAISMTGADDGWLVGEYIPANGFDQPVFLHWNGASWQPAPSGPAGGQRERLPSDVVALSRNDAWTAGTNPNVPSVEHWNGTVWTPIEGARLGVRRNVRGDLTGIDASSPGDVWAVGVTAGHTDVTGRSPSAALILHWDGHRWSRVRPAPFAE